MTILRRTIVNILWLFEPNFINDMMCQCNIIALHVKTEPEVNFPSKNKKLTLTMPEIYLTRTNIS